MPTLFTPCGWCDGTGKRDELLSRSAPEGSYDLSMPCPHCEGSGMEEVTSFILPPHTRSHLNADR